MLPHLRLPHGNAMIGALVGSDDRLSSEIRVLVSRTFLVPVSGNDQLCLRVALDQWDVAAALVSCEHVSRTSTTEQ